MGILSSLYDQIGVSNCKDFVLLRRALDRLIAEGRVRQIPVLKPERWQEQEWFLDVETGDVYAYIPLAERITPEWRKVDLSDISVATPKSGIRDNRVEIDNPQLGSLNQFPTGRYSYSEAEVLPLFLRRLISKQLVKEVDLDKSLQTGHRVERRFRDTVTGEIYSLTDHKEKGEVWWQRVSSKPDNPKIQ